MRRLSKRVASSLLALLVVSAGLVARAEAVSVFTDSQGFATKTGFRGVFAWQAVQPVKAVVTYGTDPSNLDKSALPIPGAPDSAGMAVVDGLENGATYYWQVEDLITGDTTPVQSFDATNAYTAWNGSIYTLDLLVALDTNSLPPDIPADMALEDMAQGVSVFAERLYDAMDGYARLGNVIVTDTNLDYPINTPACSPNPTECALVNPPETPANCTDAGANLADVIVQTTVPFDSHTWAGWAIDKPCVSFYVGRLGQLIVPWEDDLHFGYVSTHEMMHYAFNAPDLYEDISGTYDDGCANLQWDGSVMHNGGGWKGDHWELTELDRNQAVTPCDHHHDDTWTWDELRTRYENVPAAATEGGVGTGVDHIFDTMARGHEDGGALDIRILDRTPGLSTLTRFTPDDSDVDGEELDCSDPQGPVTTDPEGDATDLYVGGAGPNEPALDIAFGSLTWGETALKNKGKSGEKGKGKSDENRGKGKKTDPPSVPPDTLLLEIGLWDLDSTNPQTAPNISYNFYFDYDGGSYAVEALRSASGAEEFKLSEVVDASATTARLHIADLEGKFDVERDVVSILLPNSTLNDLAIKPFEAGDQLSGLQILSRRAVSVGATNTGPSADATEQACNYVIAGGTTAITPPPPPPPPTADGSISVASDPYEWEAGPFTRVATTGLVLGDACSGSGTDHCDHEYVQVDVPEGGATLNVTISTDDPTADFDLYVFAPDGSLFGSSTHEFTPPESVSKTATVPGLYTIAVNPWATAGSHYSGVASLSETVPPPPVGDFDGEISSGQSYPWTGMVTPQPVFYCESVWQNLCDNEFIMVNVPAGGATLTIEVLADEPDLELMSVHLYDPAGNRVAEANFVSGTVTLTHGVSESGIYRVGVASSILVQNYQGVASLS